MPLSSGKPGRDCPRCPRLVDFRLRWREREGGWHNAPVASFGPIEASLLIVGLAPGLQGANRTGRPFTGDYAGDLLYGTIKEYGFGRGDYAARPDDGFTMLDARITNAVRCVPPENKPVGSEIANCRPFLTATIQEMPRLKAILALGRIAHDSVVCALGGRPSAFPFGHGRRNELDGFALFDSYHCSRYNTNTRKLTPEMFKTVFAGIRAYLAEAASQSTTSAALRSGGKTG